MDNLKTYIEDIENRIDINEEEQLFSRWLDFIENRFNDTYFSPKRNKLNPSTLKWPLITVNQTLNSFDNMIIQQLSNCSNALEKASGNPLMVRPNYGTSIMPLLFGVEEFLMSDEQNCLPTSRPLGSTEKIRELVRKGIPNLTNGYGEKVFIFAEKMNQIKSQYPKIDKYVHIYHPDLQGPFDICEVIWGSEIFYAIYDETFLVKELLELVTQTYIAFMKKWETIVPFRKDINPHWGMMYKGKITLRDDSAMNLGPEQFDEFIKPYDQRLLNEFGGGICHFCGRGDHYIKSMCSMHGMSAIAMSQPEYNEMEKIYQNTVDKGIKLLGLSTVAAEEAKKKNRPLKKQVHTGTMM